MLGLTEHCRRRRVNGIICMFVLSRVCCVHGWVHINLKTKWIPCLPQAALYDKAAWLRLRSIFAVIHLCQEKTGKTEETLRQDSDGKRWVGGRGSRIKRTPEITTAFERQVQYRGLEGCWKWRQTIQQNVKEWKTETGYLFSYISNRPYKAMQGQRQATWMEEKETDGDKRWTEQ